MKIPFYLIILFVTNIIIKAQQQNWEVVNGISARDLNSATFVNKNNGTIVGYETIPGQFWGVILQTTDGGKTWFKRAINVNGNLLDVSFCDEDNGVVLGNSANHYYILRTTDGGISWAQSMLEQLPISPIKIHYPSINKIIIIGVGAYYSNDGGQSWKSGYSSVSSWVPLYSAFLDSQNGYIVGNQLYMSKSLILKTTDGCQSWTQLQPPNFPSNVCIAVAYPSKNAVYAVSNATIFKSTDGGLNWNSLHTFSISISGISFTDENTGTIIGSSGLIAHTIDGGKTWTSEYINENSLNFVCMTGANTGIILGWDDILYKVDKSTAIKKYNYSEVSTNLNLEQNYPNPFNPTTTIKFSIPSPSQGEGSRVRLVTLKVYDLLGREISTLVNEEKLPDTYEVKFNGTGLPSGVYFYRLTSAGFTQTKKLVLLK